MKIRKISQPPERKKLRRLVLRWRATITFQEYWLRWVEPPESEPGDFYWALETQAANGNLATRRSEISEIASVSHFDSWPEADRFLRELIGEQLGDYTTWKIDPQGANFNLEHALSLWGFSLPDGGDGIERLREGVRQVINGPRENDFSIL